MASLPFARSRITTDISSVLLLDLKPAADNSFHEKISISDAAGNASVTPAISERVASPESMPRRKAICGLENSPDEIRLPFETPVRTA